MDHPFDVSADLAELGRTAVTVVSSGAKSILDLPATREVLETNGVTVIGYGTEEMPAFFSRHSGLMTDARLDTPAEVANLIRAHHVMKLQNGILVTVPAPAEAAMDEEEAEAAIVQATKEADEQGIHGPASTTLATEKSRGIDKTAVACVPMLPSYKIMAKLLGKLHLPFV